MIAEWMTRAACVNHNPELWFPSNGNGPAAEYAQRICAACPVRAECLALAVRDEIDYGIWGGLTAPERAGGTPRKRQPRGIRQSDIHPRGETRGYGWHRRRHEPACGPCIAAETARTSARAARLRAARAGELAASEEAAS